jgi:hypothetical protein
MLIEREIGRLFTFLCNHALKEQRLRVVFWLSQKARLTSRADRSVQPEEPHDEASTSGDDSDAGFVHSVDASADQHGADEEDSS